MRRERMRARTKLSLRGTRVLPGRGAGAARPVWPSRFIRKVRGVVRRSRAPRVVEVLDDHERGMATAEYAIATVAAVGFAGLLVAVLRSGEIHDLLLDIIRRALTV